jgi:uncharacterized protein involved in exopolysaccharide biosynthesis
MDTSTRLPIADDEISLREIVRLLWQARWLVITLTAVCALVGAGLHIVLPKRYEAIIVISPASQTTGGAGQGGGMSSMLSEFGGLASLAGLSVGGDSRKAESLTVLQSGALTEDYIQKNNLLPVLFYKQWDAQARRWKPTTKEKMPTLWKANEFFRKSVRKIVTDTKTGIVNMTITWTDPELAAEWANGLVKLTNDYLRNKAIQQSDRNIDYLTQQAAKTDVVGVRQAIYAILQTEINKEMLARGNDEYAFKVLDPAQAPERPSSFGAIALIAAGMVGGMMLSVIIVFSRLAWRRSA